MTKDEMIEEMAKVLCDKDKRCEECISRLLLPCGYKSYCTRLYNAGYRKVGKNETVVKKSKIGMLEKTISYLEMEKAQLNKQLEQAEQEMSREILQELKKILKRDDLFLFEKTEKIEDLLPQIAIKCGIEWED